VIQAGVELGSGCIVLGSIVGEGARLGAGTQVSGLSVVGPGAHIGEGNTLDGGLRVAADAEIPPRALSFT
jgi:mannose-1-phosphate guanylyltransferase